MGDIAINHGSHRGALVLEKRRLLNIPVLCGFTGGLPMGEPAGEYIGNVILGESNHVVSMWGMCMYLLGPP